MSLSLNQLIQIVSNEIHYSPFYCNGEIFGCQRYTENKSNDFDATPRNDILEGVNTLRPRQNGRHFPDDIVKCVFLNENVWISIKISL